MKALEKKLTLNKTTLASLDQTKMSKVNGGWITIEKFCAINSLGDICTWAPPCL